MGKGKMENIYIEPFYVIGITVKTTNKDQQSAKDIQHLWERFWKENISSKVPNKVSEDIYCVYTEYEGDHTQPYTTVIGYKTTTPDTIPEGMRGFTIGGGEFIKRTAHGKLADGIVIQEWIKIWQSNIPRAYKADYEVYGVNSVNPENAEIDIFVELL